MKKRIFYAAILCILMALAARGTLAYFTAEDTVRNVITSGSVEIAHEEWQQTENGLVPYPGAPIAVMPATTVSKIITVKNLEAQSYIRVRLSVIVTDSTGKVLEIPKEELEKVILLAMNTADWTEKDGWWYCNDPVDTGKSTQPLMTQVEFDGPNMTNLYQNCTLEIVAHAQAVQTANNGGSVWEAAGWPEA